MVKIHQKNNYGFARKCGNIFRFIDYLIAVNDGKEFENHNLPTRTNFEKGNTSRTETAFLDLNLCINEGQIQTSLYIKGTPTISTL